MIEQYMQLQRSACVSSQELVSAGCTSYCCLARGQQVLDSDLELLDGQLRVAWLLLDPCCCCRHTGRSCMHSYSKP
jgi:hypothetical protein